MHSKKKGEKMRNSVVRRRGGPSRRITFVSTYLETLYQTLAPFGKGSQRPERGGKGHYCSAGFIEIFVIHYLHSEIQL